MKYVNNATKIIIRYIAILCISFVWINYYIRKLYYSLALSIILALSIEIILYLINKLRNKHIQLSSAENDTIRKINTYMLCTDYDTILAYYVDILSTTYRTQKYKDCIIAVSGQDKICYIPYYYTLGLDDNALYKCIGIATKHKSSKVIILTNIVQPSVTKLLPLIHGIDICVYDAATTYKLVIGTNTLPNSNIKLSKNKLCLKDYIRVIINKSHAKGYMLSGLILIICSIFVPYTIYYSIVGSGLMVLALICITKKE